MRLVTTAGVGTVVEFWDEISKSPRDKPLLRAVHDQIGHDAGRSI